MLSLLREWGTLAAAERAAGAAPAEPPSVGSLHRVEGAALSLLCSHDVAVRK